MEKVSIAVSIIMPILNTVSYIRECMDSLINQTLRNIEILCVDAGSTDGTREILQEYADRDSRVRVLEDTKGSTGYANNLGMMHARGKYVAIVEPDDFVAADMYENLYKAAEECHADVTRANYKIFFGNGESREYIDKQIAGSSDYGKVLDAAEEQRLFKNDMSTWAGIYRNSFIQENNIRHNETPGAAYQDNGFWFLAMAYAKRICYVPISGYRYRMDNPNSSVHNRGKIFAICDEYDFIAQRLKQDNIYDRFKGTYIWAKFIRYLSSYYRLDDTLKPEFADRFSKEMKGHLTDGELNKDNFSQGQQKLLEMLLDGGEIFHRHIAEQKQLFRKLADSGQPLVQYGCGSDGIRLLGYIRSIGRLDMLVCLCDSNAKLWGTEIFGKRICSLNEIKKTYPEAGYLVASINYEDEIRELLTENNIIREKVYTVNVC